MDVISITELARLWGTFKNERTPSSHFIFCRRSSFYLLPRSSGILRFHNVHRQLTSRNPAEYAMGFEVLFHNSGRRGDPLEPVTSYLLLPFPKLVICSHSSRCSNRWYSCLFPVRECGGHPLSRPAPGNHPGTSLPPRTGIECQPLKRSSNPTGSKKCFHICESNCFFFYAGAPRNDAHGYPHCFREEARPIFVGSCINKF